MKCVAISAVLLAVACAPHTSENQHPFVGALSCDVACHGYGEPDRVSILLGSAHVNSDFVFNETNPGLFVTWEGDPVYWSIGAYQNSFSEMSVAVTGYAPVIEWDEGNAGIFAGLALYPETGRDQTVSLGDVVPLAGVQVRQGHVFVQILPTFGNGADAVITGGLTFPLN